jgi:EAL and modified HD-GYP domain-containing signal transduction protein
VALVAEKVETHEQLARCQALGFDLCQGYFFARPKIVAGRTLGEDRLGVLQLLAVLHDPRSELADVQAVVQRSVSLSYRLLRYANSAALNLPRQINSIAQAAVILGQRRLRDMATLLALTGLDGKPSELTRTLLARARCCANLAPPGLGNAETAFTVGLFSGLDALLDPPLDALLNGLPLSDEVSAALLDKQGSFGRILGAVLALEQGDFDSEALTARSSGRCLSRRARLGQSGDGCAGARLSQTPKKPGGNAALIEAEKHSAVPEARGIVVAGWGIQPRRDALNGSTRAMAL